MTRKEVIDELQKAIDLIKQNGKDWLDERDIPILQMAITALELSDSIMLQLDCKMFHSGVNVDNIVSDETTDIIYRQAAIDAIKNNVFAVTPTQIDTKIDCIECVEKAPSVQFAKDTNVLNNDSISRQAAIDALREAENHAFNGYYKGLVKAHKIVANLPSAQPEVDKDMNAPINDCISRQAAIEHWQAIIDATNEDSRYNMGFVDGLEFCISDLSTMPSAQPDLSSYSDKLWRSAYERGKAEAQAEIVRCKDCKHIIEHQHYGDLGESAYTCEGNMDGWVLPDGFCSSAERRTDEPDK